MQIPGFEMLEKLGQGGMATVWKARQVSLDRIVAIKILSAKLAQDPADIERFQKEAQSAAKLKHAGIVQVYDANIVNGIYYFVMEYVAGYTVGDWVRRKGTLPESEALLVVECVADALDYAWDKQRIVHCDIKPDNVMVDADGTVKVSDLGLARTLSAMTTAGTSEEVMGTPAFMSPEQATGRTDLDCRADIYSLGAMLYYLVTGTLLFAGRTEEEIMDLQVSDTVPDPMDANSKLSSHVCSLIEIMLAKNRDDRQADWRAVKADIARVKKHHAPVTRLPKEGASTVQRSKERLQKERMRPVVQQGSTPSAIRAPDAGNPKGWIVGIVAAVILVLVLLAVLGQRNRPAPSRPDSGKRPAPAQTPQPATPAAGGETAQERTAREMFEFARGWAAANPGQALAAQEKYQRVVTETRGTKYALMAEEEIRRLRTQVVEGSARVIQDLQDQAGRLVQESRFEEAARLYQQYAGPYAAETRQARESFAAQLLERQRQAERTNQAQAKRADERLEEARQQVGALLISDGVPKALEALQASLQDSVLAGRTAPLEAMRPVLEAAVNADNRVIESFAAQKGKEITVRLANAKWTMTVDDIQVNDRGERRVVGREKMTGEGSSARVTIPRAFTARDLALAERLARMGSEDQPEVALIKGLLAVNSKAYAKARESFSKIPPELAEVLLAQVSRVEAQQADTAACDGLRDLLRGLGIPVDGSDPVAWVGPAEGWVAPAGDGLRKAADALDAYRKRFAGSVFLDRAAPVLDALARTLTREDQKRKEQAQAAQADPGPAAPDVVPDGGPDTLTADQLVERLQAGNPAVSPDEIVVRDDGQGRITEVRIISPETLDIGALGSLKNLRVLHCGAVPIEHTWNRGATCKVRSIGALKKLPLQQLYLGGCPIKDLSPVKGMPLKLLDIRDTEIDDISAVQGMDLETLNISRTKVKDLAPVKTLQKLKVLSAGGIRAYDFKPLIDRELAELDVSDTQFKDASILRNMRLRALSIANTKIYEFGFLKDMPLARLNVMGTQLRDLALLQGKSLMQLDISGTGVSDLSVLRGMDLKELKANDSGVRDLAPLEGMGLRNLELRNSKVSDLAMLKGMPLERLSVADTAVDNLAPLDGMGLRYLDISRSRVRDLSVIRKMPLRELFVNGVRADDFGVLRKMTIELLGIDNPDKESVSRILWTMPNLRSVNYQPWGVPRR